ncbi:MAG: protein phosphatase 2C domain-containing protein [Ruminococcus sp.]|nr:protein phosphatase 2C domain-containing protein [Ruminococcus sp.]
MNMKTFDISVLGASHIKKGTVCQDYSISNSEKEWSYAIVCDGHGGADYVRSNKGSEFGCKSAEFMINSMMGKISSEKFFSENESLLYTLEQRIIKKWRETVEAHYKNNPFTDSELSSISDKAYEKYKSGNIYSAYGTTLVAVVMTRDYWFGIQLGDGKLITVDRNGEFCQPVPENPKCFANATTSMCDKDAFENFRGCFSCDNPESYNAKFKDVADIENRNHFVAYGRELPAAVIVSSDGIDNCFKEDEQMYNLYKTVLYSFSTSDFSKAQDDLKNYLPKLSQQGSGDDISVAAILDTDVIPELSIVKEYDMDKQKQRVADAKRREQEANEAEKKIVAERVARLDRQKIEEMQGEIERLEKSLKKVYFRLQEEEENCKRLDKSLKKAETELQRSERAYNFIENDYETLKRNLRGASDSINVCYYCGIIVSGRSGFCTKCGRPVTEYRKYVEKREKLWNRRNSECSEEPNNENPDNDGIPDDDLVRRRNMDIDFPLPEDEKMRNEKIQKISEKKHENSEENNPDESYQEKHRVSLEKEIETSYEDESDKDIDINEEKNADTENSGQETAENIVDNVHEDSEEDNSDKDDINEEKNADTENSGQETAENISDDVHENSEDDESDENHDYEPEVIEGGILDLESLN